LRHKFTKLLAHFTDFDPKYRQPISSAKLCVENMALELQKRHAPSIVYAISEDPTLDQKELPLVEALKQIVGRGMGTVLSCIPGRLALVRTEDERFILERHDPLEKREHSVSSSAAKMKRVMLSRASSRLRRTLWSGDKSRVPTRPNASNWKRGSARTSRSQVHSDATGFVLGSVGLRPTPANTLPALGRWSRSLNANGLYLKKIRTDKPGYVIYEDDWQLVAEPFPKGTIRRK
jgi:hypothetical protein